MSFTWALNFRGDLHILEATTEGFATLSELSAFNTELLTAARTHAAERVLVDHRLMTGHDLDTFQIYGLPQRQQGQGATFTQRVAILFDPKTSFARDFEFYFARATNSGFNHQLFTDHSAAIAWLSAQPRSEAASPPPAGAGG